MGYASLGSGGLDDGLVDLAEGGDVGGSDVEEVGVGVGCGGDAGGGEVLGVDELVAIAAVADDPDFAAFVDELEEDGKEAETAGFDDGRAADGDDVEVVFEGLEGFFGG